MLAFLAATLLSACVSVRHETVPAPPWGEPRAAEIDWKAVLSQPGTIRHEAVVAARWEAPLSGLLDMSQPAVRAAGLHDRPVPIVLVVHTLFHPTHGLLVVDTGVDQAIMEGKNGPMRGVAPGFARTLEPVEPILSIARRQQAPITGVLITHLHFDHVLGLPDLGPEVPIYVGAGELDRQSVLAGFMRPTVQAAVAGKAPLRVWPFAAPGTVHPLSGAVDVFGDGQLWAIHTPGHTPGSTSYLALTTDGPKLFVGDTSHTWWGWENGVGPGNFTDDHRANAASLLMLKAFVAAHPKIEVYVGHELDGDETGVE